MSRKTITVQEHAYEAVDDVRLEEESFTEALVRLADEGGGEHTPNTLTEEHIDDIVARTADRTAREVENRLQTR